MAISGFKKIDNTRYDMRDGGYVILKGMQVDGKWTAHGMDEAGNVGGALGTPTTQAGAAKAAMAHHRGGDAKAATPKLDKAIAAVTAPGATPAPCEPAPCEPAQQASETAEPAPQATPAPAAPVETEAPKRSRVDTTLDAMRRPQGVSIDELIVLFEQEHGDGKRSTASQAVHKCPKARGLTVTKERFEDRGLVYRLAS